LEERLSAWKREGILYYLYFPLPFILGADKSSYEGDYFEGRKEGKGKYTWPDSSYYEGEWKDNKINGYVKEKASSLNI
jgi:hypothetical protein